MRDFIQDNYKYIPLTVGLVLLLIGALITPWGDVLPYLVQLTPTAYLAIILLACIYYAVRIIRYQYMLRMLGRTRPFSQTFLAYFEAQPAALLPGGEIYKTVTLKKHANIHYQDGTSVVFLQAFTENIGLLILALVGSLWLTEYTLVLFAVLAVYFAILFTLRSHRMGRRGHTLLNKLPFISLTKQKVVHFINRNKTLLARKSLLQLVVTGMIPPLIASYLIYVVAKELNVDLALHEAVIALSIPGVLQNVSFLPGGIGINEQSSVGLLVLFGVGLPAAVALTIIIRIVTLVLGIVVGLLLVGYRKYLMKLV